MQLGQHGDGCMCGGMGVVPPPDHLYRDRRSVSQRPEDDAVAPVLGRSAFGGDPDATVGGDDREPVIDVARFPGSRDDAEARQMPGVKVGYGTDLHTGRQQ